MDEGDAGAEASGFGFPSSLANVSSVDSVDAEAAGSAAVPAAPPVKMPRNSPAAVSALPGSSRRTRNCARFASGATFLRSWSG
jgi:hypothetical protein